MNTRGVIPVIVLYTLGALAATQLVPNWRLTHLFAKGPQTDQLRTAQDAAAKSKAAADLAEAHYNSAVADFEKQKMGILRDSQQFLAGIPAALKRAPQSPEVTLAASLADRASKGLVSAIGDLPADKQAEIIAIVDGALSAKQAEVDAAKAALAQKDVELAQIVAAKQSVEAQLPALAASVKTAEAKSDAANAFVTVKTAEVAAFADKADAKEKENGSLGALIGKLEWWAIVFAAGFLFVNFLLPSLAQEFPASKIISTVYRWTTSLTSAHKITTT